MATSGTIYGSAAKKSGVANSDYTFKADWVRNSYSIEKNTSNITISLRIQCTTYSGSAYNNDTKPTVNLKVGGIARTPSINYINTRNYNVCTFATWTGDVSHNNDGSLNCAIEASFTHYGSASLGSGSLSGTATLDTIPRASKINSFTGTDLAGNFSVSYTSYSSSFTNKLRISVPNVKSLETFNYTSGTSFKLSQTSLDYLYSYTSNTDKVQLGAVIETWSGSTKIGESVESIHDCYVPSNIKPSLGTIVVDPVNITTQDNVSRNILVKGKNKITVSISGSKAGTGSSIKSYTYNVLSGSSIVATIGPTTSTSVSFGPFQQTGDLKFRVTVTDNRGRSDSNSGRELAETCYDYAAPYISSFNAYRANSDGSANVNGTYLQCDYTPIYSQVGSTNKVTVTVCYNEKTSNTSRINLGEANTTYNVYLTITDNYGGFNKTSTITVFGQSRIFNITPNGTGFAIGKMAEIPNGYPGIFESRWPAKFDDGCEILGDCKVTGKLTVSDSLTLGTSTQIGSQDSALKYRQGTGNWQTVLTDQNIGNYAAAKNSLSSYLPLNGGTLTGKLTLDDNLYYATNTAGLDCQNSDIINVNGIYFKDASDSAGESINFYRNDGYWDTLYAVDGALKFHPNRSISSGLSGNTILSSANFRRGTCTLSSSGNTTVTFTSALGGTPTVILTPLTEAAGVIPGKVKSVSSTGFTAIIGGSAVSSALFAYLAVYI